MFGWLKDLLITVLNHSKASPYACVIEAEAPMK